MHTMKPLPNLVVLFTSVALLLLAGGCATTKHQESMLTFAGFKPVTATTPKQQQKLQALPPGKFSRIVRNGKTWYVYPEAAENRLYLGTKNEYQQYVQNAADAKISRQTFDSEAIGQADGSDWDDWGDWEIIVINPG
jgi:hypothetical protein